MALVLWCSDPRAVLKGAERSRDLLYPDLTQESDIIPHGKLLVEVEKMGISADGKCRTAKANDKELCGKEKRGTEAVNTWSSSKEKPSLMGKSMVSAGCGNRAAALIGTTQLLAWKTPLARQAVEMLKDTSKA
ncbi:hypothetical protein AV530_003085 [Patagioenas fasciata monilis]|uniref:Uncharacterized protein n=1 Tax=Patagioenas fasciata monilis TaxID=372326 RepID=A0A1V4KW02_PATFA|nr:hypothetical protein AV530_003085 [Patagioenas fasciata monilis]